MPLGDPAAAPACCSGSPPRRSWSTAIAIPVSIASAPHPTVSTALSQVVTSPLSAERAAHLGGLGHQGRHELPATRDIGLGRARRDARGTTRSGWCRTDGTASELSSWSATNDSTVNLSAGTAVPVAEIAAVQVRSVDGTVLLQSRLRVSRAPPSHRSSSAVDCRGRGRRGARRIRGVYRIADAEERHDAAQDQEHRGRDHRAVQRRSGRGSPPTITASIAMTISPATRDTALLTAEAMPERSVSIAPRIAEVSGDTVSVMPERRTRRMPGSTCHQ